MDFACTVFVLVVTGWGVYQYLFDREVSAEEIHVSKDFFDFSTVLLEPEVSAAPAGQTRRQSAFSENAEDSGSTTAQYKQHYTGECNRSITEHSADINRPSLSQENIRSNYYARFEGLKNLAITRLDQLAANALTEYELHQQTGEPALPDLVSRYSGAAKKLQKQVDATFYQLLAQMKDDLQTNGLPIDLATEAETTYQNMIKQKKAELMDKAMNR